MTTKQLDKDNGANMLPSPSSSSSVQSEEDERKALLSDVTVLRTLFSGVTPQAEPLLIKHPNVPPARFSKEFDYVLGLYRAVGHRFRGPHAPSSPEWLLLTSFVIEQNAPNFTAWKDRRDIVLHPSRLLASTRDTLQAEGDSGLWEVAREWLPALCDVQGPTGAYSVWKAVRWDLRAMECFALAALKNFQVWHHRGEILRGALRTVEPAAMESKSAFDSYLLASHDMRFSDIDERAFCDTALASDAKNYHVWLHRSWFVHAFPFLLRLPSWDSLLACCRCAEEAHDGEWATPPKAFTVDDKWLRNCLVPTVPVCPLSEELLVTARFIFRDCMNNSAWCHRFHVFERDLMAPLVRTMPAEHLKDATRVLRQLCDNEMHYALQWCAYEPCNESPFVYARSVAVVHQTIALRLLLHPHGLQHDDEEVKVEERQSPRYTNLREEIEWEVFLETFSLLTQQLGILGDVVTSRAEECRRSMRGLDDVTVSNIRRCRSQFLLDNTHQVYTARYRCLFTMLQYMWNCYLAESDKGKLTAIVPPEVYAAGDTEAVTRVQRQADGCLKFFLDSELKALQLARRLMDEDDIRRKYWKHEIDIVMHRDYA